MADPNWTTEAVEEVISLIGDEVCLLTAEWPRDFQRTGDIDCAVHGLDHQWPLRLPADLRLLQSRNYDINSWVWFIGHGNEWLMFDCIEDPQGIGRYKFPTTLARCRDGRLPDPAVRAAYLTAKRLRKDSSDPGEWAQIGMLGSQDAERYRRILASLLGERYGLAVSEAASEARVPDDELRRRALFMLRLRRLRDPASAAQAAWKGSVRWLTRLAHPTGMTAHVVGPDGSGKSTLARELPADCGGLFLRHRHAHWRPGLLPSLGSLAGTAPIDTTRPHGRPPHPPVVSAIALAYYWFDSLLGALALFAPVKARTGLIVVERGWWDTCIDPARYRITAPGWILQALGNLLMQPDLVIVLEAEPDVLMARKQEVERDELTRQARAWREALPRRVKRVYIDASAPLHEVRAGAREAVVSALSDRAAARLGPGWIRLPTSSAPRWMLPRGPRKAAVSGFSIYQPVALKARLGWEVGKGLASVGALRVAPRGEAPPEPVRTALAPYVPPRCTLSVMRANHRGRFLASIVGSDGRLHGVAKIATHADGILALEKEAGNIQRFGGSLEPPLRAPEILERAPGLLLLEPIRWIPRARPCVLPGEVAEGLGRTFARWSDETGGGAAHGDCAPWNLLRTQHGWVLVDWEEAGPESTPFFDLFHYLVQAHALLGRPSLADLTGRVPGPSWVRTAIRAYAAGSGRSVSAWRVHFREYLRASMERLDPSDPPQARAFAARRRLLRAADGSA